MNISVTSSSNPQFQALRGNLYKLKTVVDTPCACCGEKVVTKNQIGEVFERVTKPLDLIMQSGKLDIWKHKPGIWQRLQEFAAENPGLSLNKILTDKDNFQALRKTIFESIVKGNEFDDEAKAKNRKKFIYTLQDIKKSTQENLLASKEVMKGFAPLKKYLTGIKLEAFEQLEKYSEQYPEKNLSEIVADTEIYKYHLEQEMLHCKEIKEKTDLHFENIAKLDEKLSELKEKAIEIFENNRDPKIRKKLVKDLYQDYLETNNRIDLTDRVFEELDKIPNSYLSSHSFFVFAHNRKLGDGAIISSIFNPVVSTIEFIKPLAQGGAKDAKNALVMHDSCNVFRKQTSYEKFFQSHPDMPKNIESQVKYISEKILNGELDLQEFAFWPTNIVKTIFTYTNGKVSVNIKDYCLKRLEAISNRQKVIKNKNGFEYKEEFNTNNLIIESLKNYLRLIKRKEAKTE